jgi:mycothiol synthase
MTTSTTALHVGSVPLSPDSHALRLALRNWPEADQAALLEALATAAPGSTSPLVLVEARRGSVLSGAVVAQCVPGKAAIVWPPQLVEPQPLVTTSMLLDELGRELTRRDVVLAQSLLGPESLLDAEHLQAGGFSLLADLLYLQATREAFPAEKPDCPFELTPLPPGSEPRLVATIDRTYVGSMDCPQLDGMRDTADVVEGYRAIGEHRPEHWMLAQLDGRDIGCLLLADHPDQNHFELVYMGLTPEARGRSLGGPLVRAAQWMTREAGRERLVLAVDAANRPALRLYDATGFAVFDQRSVYWKQLTSDA